MPGITYPRVPGHEEIGLVEAIGPDMLGWDVATRVGVSVGSVVRAGAAPAAAAGGTPARPARP
jgi:D-arabinose 1-dehydrogenase-like Zn-dependent alcohol dehydrogenase